MTDRSGLARYKLPDQTTRASLFVCTLDLPRTMSADLFAEFSTDPSTNSTAQPSLSSKPQPASTFSFLDDLNSQPPSTASQSRQSASAQHFGGVTATPSQPETDADDDWGDFEGDSNAIGPPNSAQQDPFAFASGQLSQPPQQKWSSQPITDDLFSFQSSYPPPYVPQESWTKAPIVKAKKPENSNVLFDAEEDLEDDDDFGDFEEPQSDPAPLASTVFTVPPMSAGSSSNLVDLLGDLDLSGPPRPAPTESKKSNARVQPKSKVATRKDPLSSFSQAHKPVKSKQNKPEPVPVTTSHAVDDSWDTFDDWEASIPTPATKKPEVAKDVSPPKSVTPAPILSPVLSDVPAHELPPTNVPPPGVLLSLFPSFFAEAQEKLFKPMAAQSLPMRNKLLADQRTITYLQGYTMLASVAAHIIAGRKLRWKRDQILSQGMRIGPASSRATSGMKLTGIDRGENLKEEREASDVVRAWKDQVGRLRHVISGVNQIKAGTLASAPDLQEALPVRTLKQSEGGIPARLPCMLCGLKRDERVTAADMAVDDSFGEWWIEQVNMHRSTSSPTIRENIMTDLFSRLQQLLDRAQGQAQTAVVSCTVYSHTTSSAYHAACEI